MTRPPIGTDEVVERVAREGLLGIELARTHLVQPVNGASDYFYVSFAGQRIEFKLDDSYRVGAPYGVEMAELSGKAAACATAINDLLFDLAKKSARTAIAAMKDAASD